MADKIFKSGQARKGDQYMVYPSPAPGGQSELAPEGDEVPQSSPARNRHEAAVDNAQSIVQAGEAQAQELISQAEAQAAELQAMTELELTELRSKTEAELAAARERLSTEVHAEIEKQYHARYQGAIKALEGAAQELKSRQDAYLASLGQPAFELILALARHVMQHEMNTHPELLAGMISQALAQLNPRMVAKVTVSPGVFQLLVADDLIVKAHQEAGVSSELVDLEMDENLAPHQFNIKAGGAVVSYDFEPKLAEVLDHLKERGADSSPTPPAGAE